MGSPWENDNVSVNLLPIDRSINVYEDTSFFSRILWGIKDYILLILQILREIRKNQYDIVHICSSGSLGLIRDYILSKIASRHHIKIVFHYHFGRIPEILSKHNWENIIFRAVLRNSTASIVMDKKSLAALTLRNYKSVYFLPNPISNNVITEANKFCSIYPRTPLNILFVGHIVKTKGVFELINATVEIKGVSVRLIGQYTNSIRLQLEQIASKRDNGNWLTFLGTKTHSEVIEEMCKCGLFILPSYSEGFPNVILESMACSCPIIASDVGAIREILDGDFHDPCGIIVKAKDAEELKNAIKSTIYDEAKKNTFGKRADNKLKSAYTVSGIRNQMETIWSKI